METQSHAGAGVVLCGRSGRFLLYAAVGRTAPQHLPFLLDREPEGLSAGGLRLQQEDDFDSERRRHCGPRLHPADKRGVPKARGL